MSGTIASFIELLATLCFVTMLVAAGLGLITFAQSYMGEITLNLQSGLSAVKLQQLAPYDNKDIGGSQVKSLIGQYGSTMGILIRNKSFELGAGNKDIAANYGLLMDGAEQGGDASKLRINDQSPAPYIIEVKDSESDGCIYNVDGENYYHGQLLDAVTGNFETKGLTTRGCLQYVLDGATYHAYLGIDHNNDKVFIFCDQVR